MDVIFSYLVYFLILFALSNKECNQKTPLKEEGAGRNRWPFLRPPLPPTKVVSGKGALKSVNNKELCSVYMVTIVKVMHRTKYLFQCNN